MVTKKKTVKKAVKKAVVDDNIIPPRALGWIPDRPDIRDYTYSIGARDVFPEDTIPNTLPNSVYLNVFCPPVYDQGQLGSCTAQAIAGLMATVMKINKIKAFDPSRQFIYFNEREMEGTIFSDAGAMIRDGIKSVANIGVCGEKMWPYSNNFTTRPSAAAYKNALLKHHKALEYRRLERDTQTFKLALYNKHPIVIGFSVYENFMRQWLGNLAPMPQGRQVGGHAVLIVGYGATGYMVRNSWGTHWGDGGYFFLPYEYITDDNLSDDFWTITKL